MTLPPYSHEAQLEQLIANTPKELAPRHDLWQHIEKRMDKPLILKTEAPKPYLHQWPQWAIAATLVLAIFLGFQYQDKSSLFNAEHLMMLSSSQTNDNVLQDLLAQIAQTHQAQVISLEQAPNALVWQTSRFGAPLEQGLEELRRAGAQIYQALQANPTDKQLWQLWLWVQQRELELLQQGQKLPIKNSTQGNTL